MNIAVASEGSRVSGHFGHCEGFTVYETTEGQATKKRFLPNPGHKPGFLPEFLKKQSVEIIIAGGMGARAQELFTDLGIGVVVGAEGNCDTVVQRYLAGRLQSTGSVCTAHEHEGDCGE